MTHSNPRSHLYAAVVSSDSKASSVDLGQPDLDNTGGGGGAGNGFGDRGGGGGGGGGGDSNGGGGDGENEDKGGEGSDAGDKRKMALSMSQKFTLGYAALVGGTSISRA